MKPNYYLTRKKLIKVCLITLFAASIQQVIGQGFGVGNGNNDRGVIFEADYNNDSQGEDFIWLIDQRWHDDWYNNGQHSENMRLTLNGLTVKGKIALKNKASWDHMDFYHDGHSAHLRAGGA
ncbi:MAG: hypothetical protein MI922_17900, partial [Bacteroidales bacterium]|nr:hypothetical protein [Bacteroidales bacterium]